MRAGHHPESGAPLPDSLALTEDDHLELLVSLAQNRGKEGADRLPAVVRGALFDNVLLLGFTLGSWAFRVLYYGLIRNTRPGREPARGVLYPTASRGTEEAGEVPGGLSRSQGAVRHLLGHVVRVCPGTVPGVRSKVRCSHDLRTAVDHEPLRQGEARSPFSKPTCSLGGTARRATCWRG